MASAQDVRDVGVEPVQAFVQVGGVIHGPWNVEEIHHRVLVVLPVITARLQLGERGQRRIQGQAIVDGAVIGGGGLTSGSPGVHADLAVVEGVGQQAEVHVVGDVACDLGHGVVPAVPRSGRIVILGRQVVGVALVALGGKEARPVFVDKARVGAMVGGAAGSHRTGQVGVELLAGFPGDHVDDAGDRVRSVESRGGALDDLDPVETIGRLPIHVEDAALDSSRPDNGKSVDQDQGLPGVHALNLGPGPGARRPVGAGHDSRFLGQDVAHAFVSRIQQLAARDQVHLGDRILPQFLFARAGHDNGLGQDRRSQVQHQGTACAAGQVDRLGSRLEVVHGRAHPVAPRPDIQRELALGVDLLS